MALSYGQAMTESANQFKLNSSSSSRNRWMHLASLSQHCTFSFPDQAMETTNLNLGRSEVTAAQDILKTFSIRSCPGTMDDVEGSQEAGSPLYCLQSDCRCGFSARRSMKLRMLWLDRRSGMERSRTHRPSSEDRRKHQHIFACSLKVGC